MISSLLLSAVLLAPSAAIRPPASSSPITAVRRANRSATREPGPAGYVNAAQVYPWSEGARFRLYAAPGLVSDIALEPGERLISVAAGDTLRWIIGDTTSGGGGKGSGGVAPRTHILVKPSAAGLTTNLVIATDRRVYHVELLSTSATAMTSIAWTYPSDGLLVLRPGGPGTPPSPRPALEVLSFDYRISGDRPPWRPLRVFDDGHQVFIEFPPALAGGEAPPLFLIGPEGRPQMINYRVQGRYYVVDRLFDRAELRLGERRQQVVRIARSAAPAGRR